PSPRKKEIRFCPPLPLTQSPLVTLYEEQHKVRFMQPNHKRNAARLEP
ncbi:uncharacterized, partial [Tachysurus ichikawai]